MVKDYSNGQMEEYTKENIKMTRKMDGESLSIRMVVEKKECG